MSNRTRQRPRPILACSVAGRACLVIGISTLLLTPLLFGDQPAVTGRIPVLTHAAQIRQLSPQEVEKAYPVHLRGVVTYYDSVAPNLFVQDSTAGIWVDVAGAANPPRPGQRIDLEGVVGPGFTPIVNQGTLDCARVWGHAPTTGGCVLGASNRCRR